ncbi:hypothetical protein [Lichenibacterium ramalinae]|uniref:hypothetical protein n=1 Tax=Lichenibacterium ramalinae TaxID=2316527 RepID=UPI001010017A|nr:hypothetical protein [Lichenibacterium ramalinae]
MSDDASDVDLYVHLHVHLQDELPQHRGDGGHVLSLAAEAWWAEDHAELMKKLEIEDSRHLEAIADLTFDKLIEAGGIPGDISEPCTPTRSNRPWP